MWILVLKSLRSMLYNPQTHKIRTREDRPPKDREMEVVVMDGCRRGVTGTGGSRGGKRGVRV